VADLVFGLNPVSEALEGRRRPLELFVQKAARNPRLDELTRQAAGKGVPVHARERRDLDRLAGNPRHQGAVLRIEAFGFVELSDVVARWRAGAEPGFFLALDGITDPHNFGALLRSAEGAGCHGVIVPKDNFCPVTPVVDRTSAGALEHVPLCQVTNLGRALEEMKLAGCWVYGLAGEQSQGLYESDLRGDVVIVAGSEGKGLRPQIRKSCDVLLAIPMYGALASLNVSVAAALALFEARRQRLERAEG